jgi:hypothetical protein
MELLRLDGFMVPGLLFAECCIYVLKWSDTPTPHKEITQVWIVGHDGKKTCYIAPGEAEGFFRKYHSFDEVVPAHIDISEHGQEMDVRVLAKGTIILTLALSVKKSLRWGAMNFLLRHSNPERFGKQGRTETGRFYHTVPKKIVPVSVTRAELNGNRLKTISQTQQVAIGDGTPSKVPLIVYCSHFLDE